MSKKTILLCVKKSDGIVQAENKCGIPIVNLEIHPIYDTILKKFKIYHLFLELKNTSYFIFFSYVENLVAHIMGLF